MYLLDTNILSELVRRQPHGSVENRFSNETDELFTSVICIEEIRFGARAAPSGNRLWERFEIEIHPHISVLDIDETTAVIAGDMRAEWKRLGSPVGYRDGWIAATARRHDLIVVTRNVRHLAHIAGLRVENWFE